MARIHRKLAFLIKLTDGSFQLIKPGFSITDSITVNRQVSDIDAEGNPVALVRPETINLKGDYMDGVDINDSGTSIPMAQTMWTKAVKYKEVEGGIKIWYLNNKEFMVL